MTDLSELSSSAYWRVLQQDADPAETGEWIDAFDALVAMEGRERATFILRKLLDRARARRVPLPPVLNTPYCNTIPLAEQPQYPGNLEVEQRVSAAVRWNALAMVVRANRDHPELGGHIATYASIADLFEVGFNHFFRAGQSGDLVFVQPHAAPGVYARAYLEGRLSEEQLAHYRRETGGKGLSSYCHPYLMPRFLAVPQCVDGHGPDHRHLSGAVHALPRKPRASSKPQDARCGLSSATAKWTSPNRSPVFPSPRAKDSTT